MFLNQISKLTIGIGMFIVASASFTRQLSNFARARIGEGGFLFLVILTLIILLLLFLIFVIRRKPRFINLSMIIMMLIIGVIVVWRIKIPEEKIHILEYAVLGWFAGRDLIKTSSKIRKLRGLILACAVCIAVGILDEAFQKILPNRYFDLRDIALNSLGGALGVISYLLG